ncbi:MAG: P1 family peptidase [archaeon]|nr:P1 family peptidase [archaeon]
MLRVWLPLALLFSVIIIQVAILVGIYSTTQEPTGGKEKVIYMGTSCPAVPMNASQLCPGVLSNGSATAIRARDLGVPFPGVPAGAHNALTDISGVLLGHSTLVCGSGPLVVGEGPVRTGVTAILPRGIGGDPVIGGFFSLSGNGEFTGIHYVEETGCVIGPILLTNTGSVGTTHQSVVQYSNALLQQSPQFEEWFDLLPVVAETWDGDLNDIMGLHVQLPHVAQAINGASNGPVAEGSVGGGTGMRAFGWKAGAGTASRAVEAGGQAFKLAVYVQANFGSRQQMLVAGVPVGLETVDTLLPVINSDDPTLRRRDGSCVVVVATDAPLSATQMRRLAKRAALGLARTGGTGHTSSGDLFIAFTTGGVCTTSDFSDTIEAEDTEFIPLDPFIDAAVYATEEAIINSMVAATNMTGINDNTIFAIPHQLLQNILQKYNRLE